MFWTFFLSLFFYYDYFFYFIYLPYLFICGFQMCLSIIFFSLYSQQIQTAMHMLSPFLLFTMLFFLQGKLNKLNEYVNWVNWFCYGHNNIILVTCTHFRQNNLPPIPKTKTIAIIYKYLRLKAWIYYHHNHHQLVFIKLKFRFFPVKI